MDVRANSFRMFGSSPIFRERDFLVLLSIYVSVDSLQVVDTEKEVKYWDKLA